MAPMISNSIVKNDQTQMIKKFLKEKNKLLKLRKYIENNFEYVGKDFSKKVRSLL